jgi:hypothetical protein
MSVLPQVKYWLEELGLRNVAQPRPGWVLAQTNLVQFQATELPEGYLCLQAVLVQGVVRNKLALWNVVHHNGNALPFGQFYISAQNELAFGLTLPPHWAQAQWLPLALYHTVQVAERYHRVVESDFAPRPFEAEANDAPNPFNLLFSDLKCPVASPNWDVQEGAEQLRLLLTEQVGAKNFVQTSELEFSLVGPDRIIHLGLERPALLREGDFWQQWQVVLSTELGVLESTNDRLFVHFNQLNANSALLAYGLRYSQRKPLVTLKTALVPAMLQYPETVHQLLEHHIQAANRQFAELTSPYLIRSVLDYKLDL